MAWRKCLKNIHHSHIRGRIQQKKVVGETLDAMFELSTGQGGRRVAESTADASQINITLKCSKNCKGFRGQRSVQPFANLILGFCDHGMITNERILWND